MRKIFLAFAALLFFFSCNKKSSEPTTIIQESAGDIHNKLLDVVAISPSFPDLSQAESFSIIGASLGDWYGVDRSIDYSTSYSQRILKSQRTREQMFGPYNAEVFSRFYSSGTAAEFKAAAISLGDKINKDKSLSEVERKNYLNTLSVLSSSLQYWEEAYTNPNHRWHRQFMRMLALVNNPQASRMPLPGQGFCVTHASGYPPSSQGYAFGMCVAAVDAQHYDDAYWYIYNGSNHDYASNQANAQGSYASGVAMGNGMNIP